MLQINNGTMDVSQIIEDVMGMFDVSIRQKGLESRLFIDPAIPRLLSGDSLRVKQVLSNLIGNAVKFTHEGSIAVEITAAPAEGEYLGLQFMIKDTGIGIPDAMHQRIFERFQQLDSSYKKQFQGTGLGLAISKKLAELMGGELRVEQNPGGGSIFCFSCAFRQRNIHLSPDTDSGRSAKSEGKAADKLILLVEDDPTSREFVSLVLKKNSYQVLTACSGREALELLESETPDLILMDIQMPEMDGARATGIIRADRHCLSRHTPIIAVTAYAMKGDREKFLALGFDDYLSKPVNMNDVLRMAEKWLNPSLLASYPN